MARDERAGAENYGSSVVLSRNRVSQFLNVPRSGRFDTFSIPQN